MKHLKTIMLLFAASAMTLLISCGKDYDDDISGLKTDVADLKGRVSNLESQASKINSSLEKLSVLATAVEKNFYITEVKTTADGYELTLSNGRKITLQNGSDNSLGIASSPNITMIQLDGVYYWTIDGMLIPGTDGKPMQATGQAPKVRFNSVTNKWEISINGGVSYTEVNLMPISISNTILLQAINQFLEENKEDESIQLLLYDIISNYIENNTSKVFNPVTMNNVINNFVNSDNFNTTIINNYVNNYIANHFDSIVEVDVLLNVIVEYLKKEENKTFINNILYQVFKDYISVNASTFITQNIIEEVINNYDIDYTTIINNHLTKDELIIIIENKIGHKIDNTFNINEYKTEIINIVIENFLQIITKNLVVNIIHDHFTEIFMYEDFCIYINQYFQTMNIEVNFVNNEFVTNNYFIKKIFQLINIYFFYYHETIFNQYFNVNYNFNIYEKNNIIFIEYNGQTFKIMRSVELQSIVYLPDVATTIYMYDNQRNSNNLISIPYIYNRDIITLKYAVTPESMAQVIASGFKNKTMDIGVYYAYTNGNSSSISYKYDTAFNVTYDVNYIIVQLNNGAIRSIWGNNLYAIALGVRDKSGTNGIDYLTTFTPVSYSYMD